MSSLVADLIDRRLVRETGLTENRVGRPATMLVLDGSPYAAIGIEVNVDYLTAVAVDLAGRAAAVLAALLPRRDRHGRPGGRRRRRPRPPGGQPHGQGGARRCSA